MSEMALHIVIPERAVPKGRPRFTRAGHAYTPARTRAWEKRVGLAYLSAASCDPEWKRLQARPVGLGCIFETSQRTWGSTDLDNLLKGVSDGMNGLAYEDDRIIGAVHAHAYGEAQDRTMIVVCREVAGEWLGATVERELLAIRETLLKGGEESNP